MRILKIGDFDETFYKERQLPSYYMLKGLNFFGFTLPFNFWGSKSDFYSQFGLWDNLNGVGVAGKKLNIFKSYEQNKEIITINKPFLGDFILNKGFLAKATITEDNKKGLYSIVDYEFLPALLPVFSPKINNYYDAVNSILSDFMSTLITSLNTTLLASVTGMEPLNPLWVAEIPKIEAKKGEILGKLETFK